jgi:ribonuclease VapC
MILDTSALIAMLRDEVDAARFTEAIRRAPIVRISAATYVELAAVVDDQGDPVLSGALDDLLRIYQIEIVPFTGTQARVARDAYRRFGRGSGHPAQLNLGDCFAYALARDFDEPLLFKGEDFKQTDLELVIEPTRSRRLSEVVATYA